MWSVLNVIKLTVSTFPHFSIGKSNKPHGKHQLHHNMTPMNSYYKIHVTLYFDATLFTVFFYLSLSVAK